MPFSHMTRLSLLLALLLSAIATHAQAGQICVRSYEDRNINGIYDFGEPLITSGISASLADAQGVIIDTTRLEQSPQAALGMLCFYRLLSGQYTVMLSSADYVAVTADAFVEFITPNTVPELLDFGAQRIQIAPPAEAIPDDVSSNPLSLSDDAWRVVLQRLFLASVGAAIVIGGMTVFGTVFYTLFLRPRPPKAYAPVAYPAQPPSYATGAQAPVRPVTGAMPAVRPGTNSMPPVLPDTGPLSSNRPSTGGMRPILPDEDTGGFKPFDP